jgi:hypothetical protein
VKPDVVAAVLLAVLVVAAMIRLRPDFDDLDVPLQLFTVSLVFFWIAFAAWIIVAIESLLRFRRSPAAGIQ